VKGDFILLTRPAILLRMEEALLLVGAVWMYACFHFNWVLFAALFFAPDLFMLGYLVNSRIGSAMYNLGHTFALPLSFFAVAYIRSSMLCTAIGLIWFAHIVLDRLLGYGLKYPTRFNDTHLQHSA